MSSSIKLTNSSGKIVTITNPDTTSADVTVDLLNNAYTIATVNDFGTVPVGYTTVIVKDTDRGGVFNRIASTTANGGTIFSGTGYSWKRQYSGAVNVKWFGAKGDGVTDDTDAIQSAINSQAPELIYEGVFLISRGSTISELTNYPGNYYNNCGLLPVSNQKHIGLNATFKAIDNIANIFSNAIIDFNNFSENVTNVSWEGFTFDMQASVLSDPHLEEEKPQAGDNLNMGIYIWSGSNIKITNCTFKDAWYCGVVLFSCENAIVSNCSFENIGKATAYYPNYFALRIDANFSKPASNSVISYNEIKECGGGISGNGGSADGQTSISSNHTITNNIITDTVTGGIFFYLGSWDNFNVTDNLLDNVGNIGISISGIDGGSSYTTKNNNIHIKYNKVLNMFPSPLTSLKYAIVCSSDGNFSSVIGNTITIKNGSSSYAGGIQLRSNSNGVTTYTGDTVIISNNSIVATAVRDYALIQANSANSVLMDDNIYKLDSYTSIVNNLLGNKKLMINGLFMNTGLISEAMMQGNIVVEASNSVPQTFASVTATKVSLNTATVDTASCMSNSRFTPKVPGYYSVIGAIRVATTDTKIRPMIYKNGGNIATGNEITASSSSSVSTIVYCNGTTDYIEFWALLFTGQNTSSQSNDTYFKAILLR